MDICQKEVVFIKHGDATQQLREISLSALQGLVEHDQVSKCDLTLERTISKKRVQTETWKNGARLCQQVSY